jgi:putative colanic acid biosynthesis glycosyltransferase
VSLYFDKTAKMLNDKKDAFHNYNNIKIITPSIWLMNRVKKSFLKDRNIDYIYNGINTNVFRKLNYDMSILHPEVKGKKIILTVGSNIMDPNKGGSYVFELAKRFVNEDICFIIIGVDKRFVNKANNVITLKKTNSQEKLALYYSNANLTLITSKKETFSLVVTESLSCGTPVVGFDSGAPVEIAPMPYGYFVNYGDIDQLEITIREKITLKNPIFSYELSKYCKENFDLKIMTENYINKYKQFFNE